MFKLVQFAVFAVTAFCLLFAGIRLAKLARNQIKSKTKAQLRRAKLVRFDALALALVFAFVYTVFLYFETEKQSSAVISLNYAEASQGQNVNGTRYNMGEIICDEVLARTIEKGGMTDISVEDLKRCVSVSPLIQGNAYSKDAYHISTEFVLSYQGSGKLTKYPSDTVAQLLCNSYRDYYFDQYVNDFDISLDGYDEMLKQLDYIDATTLLSKKANKIFNYLCGLQSKNSSFVSSSGTTFASVSAKVHNLNAAQINETLFSYVLQNGISKNTQQLLKRYQYANVSASFDKQEMDQSYKTTNNAIAKYDKDMARVVLVPTWDNDGKYYMGRTKVGIDTLSVQSVGFSEKIAEIEKGIQDNSLKLAKFGAAVNNTPASREYADGLIENVQKSLKTLAEEARAIGREYYSNQMNQCISATVYKVSLSSQYKTILLVFVCAYLAMLALKTANEIAREGRTGG